MSVPRSVRTVARRMDVHPAAGPMDREAKLVTAIWCLLFLNGLPYIDLGLALAIPQKVSQILLFGALGLALVLALRLNPRLEIRPSIILTMFSFLVVVSLMSGMRRYAGLSSPFRSLRLALFLSVLWLLTPWWGRRDLLVLRAHLRALEITSGLILFWLLVMPGSAYLASSRLVGVVPAIAAPQVAQFAAVMTAMSLIFWLADVRPARWAFARAGLGLSMILLSHTRTAMLGLFAGMFFAITSLFLARSKVRRTVTRSLYALPFLMVPLAFYAPSWFLRGQSAEQLSTLTGRRLVWDRLLASPRTDFQKWFGVGLTNKSFGGLSIDSAWLIFYHETGRFGLGIGAVIFLLLFYLPVLRPPGAGRTFAIFIAAYCFIASYAEVGFGDAGPYVLHVCAAAAGLAVPLVHSRRPDDGETSFPAARAAVLSAQV